MTKINSNISYLETEQINSNSIKSESIVLNESSVVMAEDHLSVNDKDIAFVDEVPKVEVLSQTDYDNKSEEELDSNTYYYTYDNEESLVTKSELKKESDRIDELLLRIVKLEELVQTLTSE